MRSYLRILLPVFFLPLFLMPKVASAQIGPPPFGGRIVFLLPCANAAIYTIVANFYTLSPAPVPLPLIWTTFTATNITPPMPFSYPPTYIGEQILGTFDIPWVCYIPPFVFLPGLRMEIERPDIPPFP